MEKIRKRKYAVVDKRYCVACGACMKVCPKSAIAVWQGVYAKPDLEKCVGCGLCAKACPTETICITEGVKE